MSYIGSTPTTQGFIPAIDYFSGNGATVAFTLSRPVASVAQVQATIENVPQNPGDAFTVSGNTITFTSAPPSGTNNIYVYYTSPITQVIQPGQGTVGTAQIANGAVIPVDLSTGGPSWDTSGNLSIIGRYQFSTNASNPTDATAALYDQALVGPTVSGNTITFRTGTSTPAERMRIDNSGRVTAPFQPAFSALRTTSASLGGSFTTIGGWSTYVNNGSNFNASTGVFTAPVSGNYLFAFVTRGNDGSADADGVSARLIRNGTMYLYDIWGSPGRTQDGTYRNFVSGSVVMNMAAGDTAAFQANGTFLQGNFSGYLLG